MELQMEESQASGSPVDKLEGLQATENSKGELYWGHTGRPTGAVVGGVSGFESLEGKPRKFQSYSWSECGLQVSLGQATLGREL